MNTMRQVNFPKKVYDLMLTEEKIHCLWRNGLDHQDKSTVMNNVVWYHQEKRVFLGFPATSTTSEVLGVVVQ